jgi:drug/metabolite transporter (DMT)-like permease
MQNIIFLTIHIVFALGMFISFKLVDVKGLNKFHTVFVNYIVAILLTLVDTDIALADFTDYYTAKLVLPSLIIGFLFVLNFILILFSTNRVGLGLTTALNKMSVVIPVSVGIIYLGQESDILQKILGITAALLSFALILYQKKGKVSPLSYILPAMVFLISGLIDTSMEMSGRFIISQSGERELFLFGVFSTALIFSIVFSFADKILSEKKIKFSFNTVKIGVMMGVFNYLSSKMVLINVERMGGSVVFPIHNASVVLITALIGFFFFKEKFSIKQWTGIILAVISVAVIASTL